MLHHIQCKDVNCRARFGRYSFLCSIYCLHTSYQEDNTYSCNYAVAPYNRMNDSCLSNQSQSAYSFFLFSLFDSCLVNFHVGLWITSNQRIFELGKQKKGKGTSCICILSRNLSPYCYAGDISLPVWLCVPFPSVTFTTPAIQDEMRRRMDILLAR